MLYQNQKGEITGLDMSSVFNTVDREELIGILEQILDEDEVRMCRLLLSDTTLKLRFEKHEEETISSNKGPHKVMVFLVCFSMFHLRMHCVT